MALTIKQIKQGTLVPPGGGTTNLIHTVDSGKSVVLSSMIFVNRETATAHNVNVYVEPATGPKSLIGTKNLATTDGKTRRLAIVDEITLGPGDKVYAEAATAVAGSAVEFVLSGIERDV